MHNSFHAVSLLFSTIPTNIIQQYWKTNVATGGWWLFFLSHRVYSECAACCMASIVMVSEVVARVNWMKYVAWGASDLTDCDFFAFAIQWLNLVKCIKVLKAVFYSLKKRSKLKWVFSERKKWQEFCECFQKKLWSLKGVKLLLQNISWWLLEVYLFCKQVAELVWVF